MKGVIYMAKGNIKTIALSEEQYKEIIQTILNGGGSFRANKKIATALVLEANLGLRISDIVKLRLCDIVKDGERYRLNIKEQKTGKLRTFTVPQTLYTYIQQYCIDNCLKKDDLLFPRSTKEPKTPISTTAIQKHLRIVCDYLGYGDLNISTHSFRKFYATNIYKDNDYDIVLVQRLLQHSTPTVTQRYIGLGDKDLENAIERNLKLL